MSKNITIARLNTLVTANAAQFTKEMDRASSVAKQRSMSINDALGAVGVGLSIGGVIAFGKSIVDLGGKVTDLAAQADLTPRALQAISAVAMQNGVSMEDVAKASEKMRSKFQDALTNGADPLNKSLHKLGLTAQGLSGLNMEEKWQVVAQRLVNAKNQQEAMNIASDIFGEKIGPKLRTTLQELAGGLDKVATANSGMIISDSQLKRLDDFGDSLDRLALSAKIMAVNLLDGSVSFQDLWKSMKAPFTGPEKLDKMDIRNAGGLKLGGVGEKAKVWNPGDDVAEKMRKAQEAAWKKNDAEYAAFLEKRKEKMAKLNADPFHQMAMKKAQDEQIGKYMELFGQNPLMAGLARDYKRGAIETSLNATPSDSMSKIGLMSSDVVPPEQKKQTEHLKTIEATLKLINQAIRTGITPTNTQAAFAN